MTVERRQWAQTWAFRGSGGSSTLRDPDCFASLVSYQAASGAANQLFLAGPYSSHRRVNLSIYRSRNGGLSWDPWQIVYPGLSAYSSLTVLGHGPRLAVAFERDKKYRHMSFLRV